MNITNIMRKNNWNFLDLETECPLFYQIATSDNLVITFHQLGDLQFELEKIGIENLKISNFIESELKENKRKLELVKQIKTIGKQKKSKSKKNSLIQKLPSTIELIKYYVRNTFPNRNLNEIPNQFWQYVHYFDSLPSLNEIKSCAKFLEGYRMSMNFLTLTPKSQEDIDSDPEDITIDKNITTNDQNIHELVSWLENCFVEIFNLTNERSLIQPYMSSLSTQLYDLQTDSPIQPYEPFSSPTQPYGPLTRRVLLSFTAIDDKDRHITKKRKIAGEFGVISKESIDSIPTMVTQDDLAEINNEEFPFEQIAITNVHKFERSFYEILKEHELIRDPIPKDKFYKLRRELIELNNKNYNQLGELFKQTMNDLIEDRMDSILTNNFLAILDMFKIIQTNSSIDINHYKKFYIHWNIRNRFAKYLNLFQD